MVRLKQPETQKSALQNSTRSAQVVHVKNLVEGEDIMDEEDENIEEDLEAIR